MRMDVAHVERRDTNPAATVKSVEPEFARDKRSQSASVNRPVCEEQIMPCLRHHPRPGRKRPWAMSQMFERGVQTAIVDFKLPIVDRKSL